MNSRVNQLKALVIVLATVFCFSAFAVVFPIKTRLGDLELKDGIVVLNGQPLLPARLPSGTEIHASVEDLRQGSQLGRSKIPYYLFKWQAREPSGHRQGFFVLDVSGEKPKISNLIDTDVEYEWGDNHYARLEATTLYFGLYQVNPFFPASNRGPEDRIQFIYRDGRLERNSGAWAGPSKPERYIEPDESERGPCFNVANVPECIAEVERAEADARSKQRTSARKQTKTPAAASAASR